MRGIQAMVKQKQRTDHKSKVNTGSTGGPGGRDKGTEYNKSYVRMRTEQTDQQKSEAYIQTKPNEAIRCRWIEAQKHR